MKTTILTTTLIASLLALTACSEPEPAKAEQTALTEESVPMSAEPAEPTGVMNAEPVVLEADEATSATDTASDTPTSSQ